MDLGSLFEQHIREKQAQGQSKMSKEENDYKWNCIIMEIATNWNEIRRLLKKEQEGNLKNIYKIDDQWLKFIKKNDIDIFGFGDEEIEKFINSYFRKISSN